MIICSLPKIHGFCWETTEANALHAVKPPQSSHHGNQSSEVSCYSDARGLVGYQIQYFVCVCVCCMWTGDAADN